MKMSKTILHTRLSNQELDQLDEEDMLRLNREAFPHMQDMFPGNVQTDPLFPLYVKSFGIVPLEIPTLSVKICRESLKRGIKKGRK